MKTFHSLTLPTCLGKKKPLYISPDHFSAYLRRTEHLLLSSSSCPQGMNLKVMRVHLGKVYASFGFMCTCKSLGQSDTIMDVLQGPESIRAEAHRFRLGSTREYLVVQEE